MKKDNILYMIVSDDEYQLPIFIADSKAELAKESGICRDTVYKALNSGKAMLKRIQGQRCKVVKVDLNERIN